MEKNNNYGSINCLDSLVNIIPIIFKSILRHSVYISLTIIHLKVIIHLGKYEKKLFFILKYLIYFLKYLYLYHLR